MARNQCRTQGGVQWRRNLRNVPAHQAAAAAAAVKQPAAVIPAPPPLPPIRPPPQPVVQRRARARKGRARRGRARRGRAQGAIPVGRRPIGEGGHGGKNIDEAFIRNRGRYKIKRFYQFLKTSKSKEEVLQLGQWLLEDVQFIQH